MTTTTAGRRAAVFTIVQNEPVFLPIWERYYQRHFDRDDIFVLDHDSTDPTTIASDGAGTRRRACQPDGDPAPLLRLGERHATPAVPHITHGITRGSRCCGV